MFEYFAGTTFHSYGQIHDYPDATALVHREPIGPVAQIIPWNVPLLMASFKMSPAPAAGCTVVLKLAEVAWLSVMDSIEDIEDLVPPGVINVVSGYGTTAGRSLVNRLKHSTTTFPEESTTP